MTAITTAGTPGINRFTRSQLLRTASLFATDPDLEGLADLDSRERSWHRLDATDHLEIWLIDWPVGTSTGWHDHLYSEGAFLTVRGTLTEHSWSSGPPTSACSPRAMAARSAATTSTTSTTSATPRPVRARLLPRPARDDAVRLARRRAAHHRDREGR